MFLIRCFKLEKEYEEYINKDSSTQKLTEKDQTERKPRSETMIDESREHIAALPSESTSHPHSLQKVGRANSVAHAQFKSAKHHHVQLGRSVSAGIYEDDVLLVNYHKFGRDGVPYVFDDRKTQSLQKIHHSRTKSQDCMLESEPAQPPPRSMGRRHSTTSLLQTNFRGGFGAKESYKKLEALGEGSYATVYKGMSSITGTVVALKEITRSEEEGTPFTAIREASLLKELKHANIVVLHDIIHTKRMLTLVFEYVSTDLGQYMELQQNGLKPKVVKLFLFQLLRGLHYCHNKKILHRDLKPQNILINEKGELKLADFGLARAKSVPTHSYSNEVVTLWYRPPDVLLGSTDYSTSLDMWGVGCIFAEMISGIPLFPGMKDVKDQLAKIWQIMGTPTPQTWPNVTKYPDWGKRKYEKYPKQRFVDVISNLSDDLDGEDLLSQMLVFEPSERIAASVSLKHRYFGILPEAVHHLMPIESIYINDLVEFPG